MTDSQQKYVAKYINPGIVKRKNLYELLIERAKDTPPEEIEIR
jgi:hypothetical protein